MTPHQPANQGSRGHELVHEAFDGEQQIAVAVGDRGAVVADRDRRRRRKPESRAPPPRCRPWPRCPRLGAQRVRQAGHGERAPIITRPSSAATESRPRARGTADRRRGRPASCDAAGRAARLRQRLPVHVLEQQRVLALDMRKKVRQPRACAELHREPDQRRADRADAGCSPRHREPRSPPDARSPSSWMRTVPTTASAATPSMDSATIGIANRRPRRGRRRNRRLLVAEHLPPQRRGASPLPGFGGVFDLKARARNGLNGSKIMTSAPPLS